MYEGLSFQLQRAVAGRRAGSPGLQSGAHLGLRFVSGGDIGPGSEPVTDLGLLGGEPEFPGLRNVSMEKPERPLSQKEPGREQRGTQAGSREAPRRGQPSPRCPRHHAGRTPGPPAHSVGLPEGVSQGPGPAVPPGRNVCLWLGGVGPLVRKCH